MLNELGAGMYTGSGYIEARRNAGFFCFNTCEEWVCF